MTAVFKDISDFSFFTTLSILDVRCCKSNIFILKTLQEFETLGGFYGVFMRIWDLEAPLGAKYW
jgi:hypothetical protein